MLNISLELSFQQNFPICDRILKNIYCLLYSFNIFSLLISVGFLHNLKNVNSFKKWEFIVLIYLIVRYAAYKNYIYIYRNELIINEILYYLIFMLGKTLAIIGNIYINFQNKNDELNIINLIIFNIIIFYEIIYITFIYITNYLIEHDIIILNRENLEISLRNTENIIFEERLRNTICSICLEEIKENEELKKTRCNHIFHSECIIKWFKISNTCPICRFEFINQL